MGSKFGLLALTLILLSGRAATQSSGAVGSVVNAVPVTGSSIDGIGESAIHCAGLYYILSSTPENAGISQIVGSLIAMYGYYESQAQNRAVTRGESDRAKNKAARSLGELYDQDPNAVVDEFFRCRNWQMSVASYFAENGLDAAAFDETDEAFGSKIILGIPTTLSDWGTDGPDRDRIGAFVISGFEAWDVMGRITTDTFRDWYDNEFPDG